MKAFQKRLAEKAVPARIEFEQNWKNWTVRDVAVWWRKWCTMDGTNHDNLGNILMTATGVKVETSVPFPEDA